MIYSAPTIHVHIIVNEEFGAYTVIAAVNIINHRRMREGLYGTCKQASVEVLV